MHVCILQWEETVQFDWPAAHWRGSNLPDLLGHTSSHGIKLAAKGNDRKAKNKNICLAEKQGIENKIKQGPKDQKRSSPTACEQHDEAG